MDAAGNFGPRLKELREAKGISQRDLALRAGIGQRTVSNLEQGRNQPTWKIAISLAGALDVDCRAFLEAPAERDEMGPGRPKTAPNPEVSPMPAPAKKIRGRKRR
jgi:transcriptional regulator with XRE-family HTH domain